jgi:hypothetical protein
MPFLLCKVHCSFHCIRANVIKANEEVTWIWYLLTSSKPYSWRDPFTVHLGSLRFCK